VLLSTQYFRPPFPDRRRWREDLQHIKRTGLDGIGFWVPWGWVEPEPDRFVWDDFDELVEEAGRTGLKIVPTAVAELMPYWIHRVVPNSELVDHTGRRVQSSTLAYNPNGACPGGCTDHPEVAARMHGFLKELGSRYAGAEHLVMWDCWNEIRWITRVEGYVCYCEHTLASFRSWLRDKHGDLDGLNRAWNRRYCDWDDVQPGKDPGGAWVETVEFQTFLSWRTARLLEFRAGGLRAGDPDPSHPIMAHTFTTSPIFPGGESKWEQSTAAGNDFELASLVDDYGISMFGAWGGKGFALHGARLECARGASAGKAPWISELQGGSARHGFVGFEQVTDRLQQRWMWSAYARGVKAINFWCWRDEVFGREASGFGIVGDDGYREERLVALERTARVIDENRELLDGYRPADAKVAVLFEPLHHEIDWAQYGADAWQSAGSNSGWLCALERVQAPYDVVASTHLPELDRHRLLIMPWAMIVRPGVAERVLAWVQAGGTLVTESELDAYDEMTFYRYPEERPFANALGIRGAGRRPVDPEKAKQELNFRFGERPDDGAAGFELAYEYDGVTGAMPVADWIEPLTAEGGETLADTIHGAAIVRRKLGAGTVVAIGTHLGVAYHEQRNEGFERLVAAIVEGAGAGGELRCSAADGELVQWRLGRSGGQRLLFVSNAGDEVEATFEGDVDALGEAAEARDLLTDAVATLARDGDRVTLTARLAADASHVFLLDGGDAR
jgi:beta-galactosidase